MPTLFLFMLRVADSEVVEFEIAAEDVEPETFHHEFGTGGGGERRKVEAMRMT